MNIISFDCKSFAFSFVCLCLFITCMGLMNDRADIFPVDFHLKGTAALMIGIFNKIMLNRILIPVTSKSVEK